MDPLFDERLRDDLAYKRSSETTYAFLDRTAQPELAWPRGPLNEWFARWPADDREELRARFMAKDAASFTGALWELYLHEVHARLGFDIERDPDVPHRATHPDFLMRRGDSSFYLEATVAGPSTSARSLQRREDALVESINQAHHPDFRLRIRGVSVGPTTPSRRAVVAVVLSWLSTLDVEAERAKTRGALEQPVHLEVGGSHILACPWPAPPGEPWAPTIPMVITRTGRGGIVNEPPMLLDDLKDKASKFGRLDAPYVIALLAERDFTTEHDLEQTLYGPEVVHVAVTPDGPIGDAELGRVPRGFWQHDTQLRATRVSAVLSAIHLTPWSLRTVEPQLWLNPWAERPLADELPWATVSANLPENLLKREPATIAASKLLGISEEMDEHAAAMTVPSVARKTYNFSVIVDDSERDSERGPAHSAARRAETFRAGRVGAPRRPSRTETMVTSGGV